MAVCLLIIVRRISTRQTFHAESAPNTYIFYNVYSRFWATPSKVLSAFLGIVWHVHVRNHVPHSVLFLRAHIMCVVQANKSDTNQFYSTYTLYPLFTLCIRNIYSRPRVCQYQLHRKGLPLIPTYYFTASSEIHTSPRAESASLMQVHYLTTCDLKLLMH